MLFDSIIEMSTKGLFLPLQVAIKYYQKWECDVSCQMEDSIYYKCLNGNGSVQFFNGNSYSGGFRNGFMHGKGFYRWKNGLLYEGDITDNTITGQGKLRWPDGSHYSGSVVQGRRHGYGEYYCSIDGSNYRGDWSNGVKEGKGVLTFANGAVFEGEFKGGLRHGQGKMKYQSGNEYDGAWKEDKKEGSGVMSWHTTLERYEGEWKQDTPWGMGSYYWFEGRDGKEGRSIKTIFKGEWKQGQREGFGTFFYNNGCRLEGTFANNMKEGVCFLVDEFGQGHLETFRGDKSVLKKEEICVKVEKKHFRLPDLQKKEVGVLQVNQPQENSYWRYLDFQCGLVDQSICNVLLRENSQLRQWHRALMSSQGKDMLGGFNLEGLWRLVRDMRLTDESITLARLNREFFKGSRARFEVDFGSKAKLQTIKDNASLLTPHNYYSIEWDAFFEAARQLPDWQEGIAEAPLVDVERVSLNRQLNIHSSQHTVLFRHFVAYILHLALLRHGQGILDTPGLSFRKCLEDLFVGIKQAVAPVGSFKTEKNCSEMMTNVSHSQQSRLHIPEEYSTINHTLFSALSSSRPQLLNTRDETVAVRQVYCLLGQCGLLREPAEKMLFLEKIQRNMSVKASVLRKENKASFPALEKVILRSPHFAHILNYEMIEAELDDILYVFLNRKIGNTQSKEEFLKKYRETVRSLVTTLQDHVPSKPTQDRTPSKPTPFQFNFARYSCKDRQKDAFLQRAAEEKKRLIEAERKVQEAMREQKERTYMEREDFDVKDEDPSETSQQYYD